LITKHLRRFKNKTKSKTQTRYRLPWSFFYWGNSKADRFWNRGI